MRQLGCIKVTGNGGSPRAWWCHRCSRRPGLGATRRMQPPAPAPSAGGAPALPCPALAWMLSWMLVVQMAVVNSSSSCVRKCMGT